MNDIPENIKTGLEVEVSDDTEKEIVSEEVLPDGTEGNAEIIIEKKKIPPLAVHSSSMLSDFARDQNSPVTPNDPLDVELPEDYKLSPEEKPGVFEMEIQQEVEKEDPSHEDRKDNKDREDHEDHADREDHEELQKSPQPESLQDILANSPSKIKSEDLEKVIPGFETLSDLDKQNVLNYVISKMVQFYQTLIL